ncbi:MAG: quinone-dependent dihydroorotate dehydrogenase [Micavibrio aeruginosavorus]|uniref:Dihydroorotate dehydrogenase (quinone) n=1 Tax=Micavibrio aeruginosavorus TaxID=349221 RepID=A0A2W5FQ67_9BACT|nr:MAG: quinone-dependent dihydroorotate dehydrogenase [Micavibrio aeruginosavorus]
MFNLIKHFLFRLDAENAHRLTIEALKRNLAPAVLPVTDTALRVELCGRIFPNPVGLAAGFDKNAEVIAPMLKLGFGFVEVGTVTIKPQKGNPRPRVFREPNHGAVINRMGFPNKGVGVFKANLHKFLTNRPRQHGVVGINIGMNKDQTDPASDYTALIRTLGPLSDYITINISSPNTPGLRNLQEKAPLTELLSAVLDERKKSCGVHPPPVFVKLAPDLDDAQVKDIADVLLTLKIDGVILTNTTLYRPEELPQDFREQKGGLSGAPLTDLSTAMIRRFYALTDGRIPIIGAGGISSGEDAYAKIRAGATLVQLYSGLVFHGPALIRKINLDLLELLRSDGFSHITEAVGADHKN